MLNQKMGRQSTPAPNPAAASLIQNPSPTPEQTGGNFFGDFFNKPMTDDRAAMIQDLLAAGVASSRQGSPMAALVAPLVSGMIGRSVLKKSDAHKAKGRDEALASAMGEMAQNPAAKPLIDVMNNPNAPEYAKSIAKKRLDNLMGLSKKSRSGGGRPRAPAKSDGRTRIMGEYKIDGKLYGRDRYGQLVPYLGPDGKPVEVGNRTRTDPLDALDAPVVPQSGVDQADPLGILGVPPA
jgi:hypothetical protein